MSYITVATCPVCGEVLDSIIHPEKLPSGMAMSMLVGPCRKEHGEENPSCRAHHDWTKGWNAKTKELKE